jgi:PAS domain S-box-containing protein
MRNRDIMIAERPGRAEQASTLREIDKVIPGILTTSAGLFAIFGGALTLFGWAVQIPRLTDWAGYGISMLPNAAVCSITGGIALILLNHCKERLTVRAAILWFAFLTTALGGLTLFEHLTGIDLRIDELFFEGTWGQAATMAPMRMGVPASLSFMLLGTALALATGNARPRRIAATLAVIPIAIASLSQIGYLFGASQLYGLARYTGIAWQASTIILVLGIGLVAALRECGFMAFFMRPDAGGLVARRLLLPIIIIPILLGWIRIYGTTYGFYDDEFGTALRTLFEIAVFLGFLWWTSNSISSHAATAREATHALYASEARFSRFMQSLPGLAWIKDLKGRYVYANDAAMKAFQKTKEELYGFTDAEILPADTAAEFMENDRRALREPAGLLLIETLQHSDGLLHSSLVSKFPIADCDDNPSLIGGVAIDISDRLRAEEALKEAHRRKDEFIATLAHELRNPLSPIHFSVEICRSQADPAKRDWALDVIDRQVRQMARLLDDLLDVSRISYGKLTLRFERVELARIVAGAVETSQPLRNEANQSLQIALPDHPVFLHADAVRLEQVFANLLNNAAKYGGMGTQVVLKATTHADTVIVSICDNGAGIPKDKLVDIFEMFSQVKSPSGGSHGGLGIGLSLVKGLVRLHSGTIEARSEGDGWGSEFIVCLPLHPDDAGMQSSSMPGQEDTNAGSATGKPMQETLRLLIADDLRDNTDSLAACFRAVNHEVRTAYDGEEALAEAEDFRPDVMFLDIGMPKLGGDEICRRIRAKEWGKQAIIVALTGWGQDIDRLRTADAGFDHHLVKPVKIDELLTIIAAVSSEKPSRTRRPEMPPA